MVMGGGETIITRVLEDVLPCISMLVVESCTIFLTIAASTTMGKEMSPLVFVVYTNALASIILLPYSFISHRSDKIQRPLYTSHLLWRVFLLGLIGVTVAQNISFLGLLYSSPIAAISMTNIVPALSFMLTAIVRSGKIDWRSVGSLAKIIGSLISMMGAISVTFYKGPLMRQYAFALSSLRQDPWRLVFTSKHNNWATGCLLFAGGALSLSVWNMVQAATIKKHPQVFRILSLYSLVGTILSAAFAIIVERDPNAWKLELNLLELLVIVLTAIFQSLIRSNIQLWCTRKRGPQFVAAFKPFGIIVASICGCTIFADTFHYGSMLSAFICGLGYYTLMWGNIRDEEPPKCVSDNHGDCHSSGGDNLRDQKVPLLEGEEVV